MEASLLRSIKSLIAAAATLAAAYAIAAAPPLSGDLVPLASQHAIHGSDVQRFNEGIGAPSSGIPTHQSQKTGGAARAVPASGRAADQYSLLLAQADGQPVIPRQRPEPSFESARMAMGSEEAHGVRTYSILLALLGIVGTIVSRRWVSGRDSD